MIAGVKDASRALCLGGVFVLWRKRFSGIWWS